MMSKLIAAGTVAILAGLLICTAGCRHPNDNVQVDSTKTVKPLAPEERDKITNNPNIPAGLKGMMLGKAGGPPRAGAPGAASK